MNLDDLGLKSLDDYVDIFKNYDMTILNSNIQIIEKIEGNKTISKNRRVHLVDIDENSVGISDNLCMSKSNICYPNDPGGKGFVVVKGNFYGGMNNAFTRLRNEFLGNVKNIVDINRGKFKTTSIEELIKREEGNTNLEVKFSDFIARLEYEMIPKGVLYLKDRIKFSNVENSSLIDLKLDEMVIDDRDMSRKLGGILTRLNEVAKKYIKNSSSISFDVIRHLTRSEFYVGDIMKIADRSLKKLRIDKKFTKEYLLYQRVRKLLKLELVRNERRDLKVKTINAFKKGLKLDREIIELMEERRSVLGVMTMLSVTYFYIKIIIWMKSKDSDVDMVTRESVHAFILLINKDNKLVKGRYPFLREYSYLIRKTVEVLYD